MTHDHIFEAIVEKKLSEEVGGRQSRHMFSAEEVIDAGLSVAREAISFFRTMHSRSLACHCECLGMNAENMLSACNNSSPPYGQPHYHEVMQKWGIVNEKGEPIL